jgi:hypothetical protein
MPFLSDGRRSPMGRFILLRACDAEKTSAVMVLGDEKVLLGGDEEDGELMELCEKGPFETVEGLVLLELGPPAICSFVLPL